MTQAASMAGYYTEINILSWQALQIFELLMVLIIYLARLYIWNKGYSISQDTRESVGDRALGTSVHDAVETEMKDMMYEYTSTHFPLYAMHKHWMYAQQIQLAAGKELQEGEEGDAETEENVEIEDSTLEEV